MRYTQKQKGLIKAYYPYLILKFKADGTVLAQKTKGGAWGILYTPKQAAAHLKALES